MYAEATDSQQGAKYKKLIEIPFGENLTVGNPLTNSTHPVYRSAARPFASINFFFNERNIPSNGITGYYSCIILHIAHTLEEMHKMVS